MEIWGFLKWGYPYIIHLDLIFLYKPSSYWGTPILGNHHILGWVPENLVGGCHFLFHIYIYIIFHNPN